MLRALDDSSCVLDSPHMRSRSLALRLVVPAALVVLVGLLATLQYHWLGQVSAAERESKKTTLRQRAEAFADDFDREIVQLYIALQTTRLDGKTLDLDTFARSYDGWRKAARDPQIVRAVYFLPSADSTLQQYDPDAHTFGSAEWPEALAPVRDRGAAVTRETTSVADSSRTAFAMHEAIVPSAPALVIPLSNLQSIDTSNLHSVLSFRLSAGLLIAYLDRDYLRSQFLPALAAKYFPERDADAYRFAIIDAVDHSSPILSRGLPDGVSIDPKAADAVVSLFSLRLDLGGPTMARATFLGVGRPTGRDGSTGTAPAPGPMSMPLPGGAATATGAVSIVVESHAPAQDVVQMNTRAFGRPAWQLVLQHSAGSLDAAVSETRRRNLWLSFSILAVLGAGVALIVINAQRSQRLAAQQMDFVATVSHELRTPLAVIRSAAQNLSAGVVHDHAQAKRYGDLIEAEGRRLTGMVEQVLEFAGLSGNRPMQTARPIDIGATVADVLASCEALLRSERIEVSTGIGTDVPPVLAEEDAIRRAVANLVTNAVKYGADGRWMAVTVKSGSWRGQDEVQVSVSDHGRGIDPADLPHVFEPFYRGRHAMDRQIHGNGLGLSLVKRITEAHGGRVTVKSAPGEGATFTLHLPTAKPGPATAAPREMPSQVTSS